MDRRCFILLLMPAMCTTLLYRPRDRSRDQPRDIGACCLSCDYEKDDCKATCHPDNAAFSADLCIRHCQNVAQWCKDDCRGRRYSNFC